MLRPLPLGRPFLMKNEELEMRNEEVVDEFTC